MPNLSASTAPSVHVNWREKVMALDASAASAPLVFTSSQEVSSQGKDQTARVGEVPTLNLAWTPAREQRAGGGMEQYVQPRDQDAYATIRGFVYQVDLTILRWIDLQSCQALELERGEDIDLVARALAADSPEYDRLLEQVKHQVKSVTLRHPAALEAIANAIDHRAANPTLSLLFRYTTNARVGVEKPSPLSDRIPLLHIWQQVRKNEPGRITLAQALRVLRDFITGLERPGSIAAPKWEKLRTFFCDARDEEVSALVCSFEWVTHAPAMASMTDRVQQRLINRQLAASQTAAAELYPRLFLYLFKLLSTPGSKRLTRDGLHAQLAQPTLVEADRTLLMRVAGRIDYLEVRVGTIERALSELGDSFQVFAGASGMKDQQHFPQLMRMPNPVSPFVGRDEQVDALIKALRDNRSVTIEGPGGIGKTQLLLHALDRLQDQRRVHWVSVEVYAAVSDLQLALSRALSGPDAFIPPNAVVDALADEDVWIIFDGVERIGPAAMDDLDDFFRTLLTKTKGPHIAFTSQAELTGLDIGERFLVRPLDDDAGMAILRSAVEPDDHVAAATEERLHWLVAFCDGHALSLRLASGLLRYFKSALAVIARIRHSGAAVLQSPTRQRQTPETSLRACLLVSYQTLTASQRRVLWFASNCPAGCLLNMLAPPDKYGVEDLDGDVAALRRWHLLDVFPEPIATIAAMLSGQSADDILPDRTSGKPIPRALSVTMAVWSSLALVAGGFLAVAEQLFEGDVPIALACLPMCIKYGCDSPGTLGWFRFGVRLRRASRLLAMAMPPPDDIEEDEKLRKWVRTQRRKWLKGELEVDPTEFETDAATFDAIKAFIAG